MDAKERDILVQMRQIGRDLFLRGLVSSHAGNMSVRMNNEIYITRTKAVLGRLKKEDVVRVPLEGIDERLLRIASSETPTHVHIYRETRAKAVIHAHPRYAVLLSIIKGNETLNPADLEGRLILNFIPFISVEEGQDREEKAKSIVESLKENKIVVVSGHGSFAIGENLEEAYIYTMSLESSCFFLYHLEILNRGRER